MRGFKRKRQPPYLDALHSFMGVMKDIEKIKDEFLAAARLTRHEAAPVVTANNVLKVAAILGGTIVLSALIICAYLSGNPHLQGGVAFVSLLSFVIVGMGLSD